MAFIELHDAENNTFYINKKNIGIVLNKPDEEMAIITIDGFDNPLRTKEPYTKVKELIDAAEEQDRRRWGYK